MWKCPNCGQKNRINVCSKCGREKSQNSSGSISSASFITMVIISLAIIIGIFFAVDSAIDYKKRQDSYERQQAQESMESYVPPVIDEKEE